MRGTRWIVPAAALAIALSACARPVEAQRKRMPERIAALVGPASPAGWYTSAEFEHAVKAAETLGQPLALMYQDSQSDCPKHNAQRDAWLRAAELTAFVRVNVDTQGTNQPHLIQKLRQDAGSRAGRFIPQLFLSSPSGELLGVAPYGASPAEYQVAVAGALRSFGGVLPSKTIVELWDKLETARTHWENGKTDAALKCYQAVNREESKNPKLAIFAELHKDEKQIEQKGAEEIAAVQPLLQEDKRSEARAAVAAIRRRYLGFKPAEDAKALLSADGKKDRTAASATPAQAKPATRTWSDVSGKHQIEAELVAAKPDSVRLKKATGECVDVPLVRLVSEDRQYVQQWLAEHRGE